MITTKVNSKLCSPKHVAQLSRAVAPIYQAKASSILGYPAGLRIACAATQTHNVSSPRSFSTTSATQLRDFFPRKETAYIRQTPAAWPHHGYTEEEMLSVVPDHREPRTLGDKVAWKLIRICRYVVTDSYPFLYTELSTNTATGGEWISSPAWDQNSRSTRSTQPLI